MEKIGQIEIIVKGQKGNLELSPNNYDIREIIEVLQNAENLFNQQKYSEAVTVYKELLAASPAPTPTDGANARYGIAFILAYYDNPQQNYAQAIEELDEFLRLYPDNVRVPDAQNLRFLLKVVIDLKKENEHLSKRIGQLNKSIEQLKKLDIRHEVRRLGK